MFVTSADRYQFNVTEAQQYFARPAKLTRLPGIREDAVMIKNGERIKAVLPIAEALRLANEIADAIAAHNQKN